MLKERLNLSLNEEGSRALAQIVARTGLSRTAVIETVLIDAARGHAPTKPSPDPERKAAKVERRAELAQAARTPDEILASAQAKIDQQRKTYCPTHRPKWCPDDCKHRVAET